MARGAALLLLVGAVASEVEIFLIPRKSVPRKEVHKESGCLIEFREVQYEWTVEPPKPPAPKEPPKDAAAGAPDAAPTVAPKTAAPPIPQLVQFRVDCQEPKVEGLTALEVWDKHHNCGRVDYTKYLSPGSSSHPSPTHPTAETVKDKETVVLQSGDVIDFRCVLAPARLDDIVVEHLDDDAELEVQWQVTFAFNVKLAKTEISVVGVEVFKASLPVVAMAEKIKQQMDLVKLREACRDALKAAYDWKLLVSKSQANRHRVKFQSPELGANFTRLEEFDDPNYTLKEMGVASFANGLQLAAQVTHAKCENVPEHDLLGMLKLSSVEWTDQGPSNSHAVAMDLHAEVGTLPPGTKKLEVTLEAHLWGSSFGKSSGLLELPVVNPGTQRFLSSPRVFAMQVVTVVCFLLLGMAFFYKNRQRRQRTVRRSTVNRGNAPNAALQEVELQSPK